MQMPKVFKFIKDHTSFSGIYSVVMTIVAIALLSGWTMDSVNQSDPTAQTVVIETLKKEAEQKEVAFKNTVAQYDMFLGEQRIALEQSIKTIEELTAKVKTKEELIAEKDAEILELTNHILDLNERADQLIKKNRALMQNASINNSLFN